MRKSLKVLALLLVALFAVSVFAGCKPSNDPVDGSSAVETQSDVTGSGSGEGNDVKDPDSTGSEATGSQDDNKDEGDTNSTASGNSPVLGTTGGKKQKVNKTGWPIVKDKITIKVMGIGLPQYGDAKNMSMFKWYEKQSNVKFEFEAIAGGETAINQKKATVMQSGKFPDMFSFYNNTFSEFEIDKYGKEGAFVDVNKNDMLKTYAPKIYKELENPINKALNVQNTGEIYTIPNKTINQSFLDYDHWLNINKTWLDNLKLKVPTTMTELRNVLRAFRDGDPNRNGQKDELPMAVWIWNDATVINGWGIQPSGAIGVDKKGKVYYARTTENAHQACIYWNQILNENGLMDKELDGSDGNGQYTKFINKIATGTVGVFNWSYITGWKKELLDQYIPIPYPTANFVNPELDLPKANQPFNSTPTRGCKIITRDCDYPEAVLRYYDYLYTDAGIMLANYGSPDDGLYKQKSDGSYYLTSKAKGVDIAKTQGLSWTMRAPETNCMDKLLDKSEGVTNPHGAAYEVKAAEVYAAALKKDPRPAFIYNRTAQELAQLRKFSSYEGGGGKLSRYVEGYDDLAGWATWVNSQKSNEEACIKLWQSIVDKHKSNVFMIDGDLKF
ncbi:MAG: hypothetical protein E7539_01965 [Ruminococcaceae bacterium]|nr:hypothetical protein [Oscillospiraceae bacterium]